MAEGVFNKEPLQEVRKQTLIKVVKMGNTLG